LLKSLSHLLCYLVIFENVFQLAGIQFSDVSACLQFSSQGCVFALKNPQRLNQNKQISLVLFEKVVADISAAASRSSVLGKASEKHQWSVPSCWISVFYPSALSFHVIRASALFPCSALFLFTLPLLDSACLPRFPCSLFHCFPSRYCRPALLLSLSVF